MQKKELIKDPLESDAIPTLDLAELDEFGNAIDISSENEPPARIIPGSSVEQTDSD